MKGDIAFVGFMLTADEWQALDAQSRAQLIAVATRRADPHEPHPPRRFPDGTGKHEVIDVLEPRDVLDPDFDAELEDLLELEADSADSNLEPASSGELHVDGDVVLSAELLVDEDEPRAALRIDDEPIGCLARGSGPIETAPLMLDDDFEDFADLDDGWVLPDVAPAPSAPLAEDDFEDFADWSEI